MVKVLRSVAIIPARGGSKRIPQKNIVDLHGRPMIAWTVAAALDSELFDRVVVSTDDVEIAQIAMSNGADVPFLRDGYSDDHSTVSTATIGTLEQLEQHGEVFDTTVQLMPSCPLRTAAHIIESVHRFRRVAAVFQLSCCRYGWLNPWWAMSLDLSGVAKPLFPDAHRSRSQDLDELYCVTGAIWIARTEALRAAGTFRGPGHVFHELPLTASVDVDNEHDLELARQLAAMRRLDVASD